MMSATTFEQDITTRVPAIQDLFATTLETHCGDGDAGITTICERLGVHRKLAWQIRNVAYSPDPFRAIRFMPSRAGIDTLAQSLRKRDVADTFLDDLYEASDAFDELVKVHAGDRVSLEMLVESSSDNLEEHADVKWREKSFLGNSFIWGVQAKTQLSQRFQEAIDRAAMRAGKGASDAYLEEWRRVSSAVEGAPDEAARAAAEALESGYDDARLERLIKAGGVEPPPA